MQNACKNAGKSRTAQIHFSNRFIQQHPVSKTIMEEQRHAFDRGSQASAAASPISITPPFAFVMASSHSFAEGAATIGTDDADRLWHSHKSAV